MLRTSDAQRIVRATVCGKVVSSALRKATSKDIIDTVEFRDFVAHAVTTPPVPNSACIVPTFLACRTVAECTILS